MTEDMTIEEAFSAMDEILEKMNEESVSIEEAFSYYEKGMKLLKDCNSRLSTLEAKVEKINSEGLPEDFVYEE